MVLSDDSSGLGILDGSMIKCDQIVRIAGRGLAQRSIRTFFYKAPRLTRSKQLSGKMQDSAESVDPTHSSELATNMRSPSRYFSNLLIVSLCGLNPSNMPGGSSELARRSVPQTRERQHAYHIPKFEFPRLTDLSRIDSGVPAGA